MDKLNNIEIINEFINELQLILESNIPEIDSEIAADIRTDANEALYKILVKYEIIER